ncbi:sterile alpha motif domain-containing protein 1-like [Ammospiza nelsoni]|uniref:sterile alpha motif domain-containing protein 1-like n=1 Tax=Ammospiza nelsoni TaxID=2857394 RepID=UPI00286CC347|nr:sterile alpha motif domain-containing protein 1-like [Ammospiza nelsoni]
MRNHLPSSSSSSSADSQHCSEGDEQDVNTSAQLLAQQQPKFRGSSFPRGSGARAAVPPPLRRPRAAAPPGRSQPGPGSRRSQAGHQREKSFPPLRATSRCLGKLVARKGLRESPSPPAPGTPADLRRSPPTAGAPYLAERPDGLPPASPAADPGAGDAEPGPARPGPGAAAGGAQRAALRGLIPARAAALPGPALPCPRGHPPSGAASPRPPRRARGGRRGGCAASLPPSLPPFLPRAGSAHGRTQRGARHRLRQSLRAARSPQPGRGPPGFAGQETPFSLFTSPRRPAGAARAPPVAGAGGGR